MYVYAFWLNDGTISQSGKRQSCITLFIMVSKYVTCLAIVQEGVWLSMFPQELGLIPCTFELITIYCDNVATLAYAKNPKYHGCVG